MFSLRTAHCLLLFLYFSRWAKWGAAAVLIVGVRAGRIREVQRLRVPRVAAIAERWVAPPLDSRPPKRRRLRHLDFEMLLLQQLQPPLLQRPRPYAVETRRVRQGTCLYWELPPAATSSADWPLAAPPLALQPSVFWKKFRNTLLEK